MGDTLFGMRGPLSLNDWKSCRNLLNCINCMTISHDTDDDSESSTLVWSMNRTQTWIPILVLLFFPSSLGREGIVSSRCVHLSIRAKEECTWKIAQLLLVHYSLREYRGRGRSITCFENNQRTVLFSSVFFSFLLCAAVSSFAKKFPVDAVLRREKKPRHLFYLTSGSCFVRVSN